jgi:DNA-binding NarL/FixJ family response regulator
VSTGNNSAVEKEPLSSKETIEVWTIEDSETYREAIVRVLNSIPGVRCGNSFSSVEDGIQALKKGSGPRVLFLDINLPGMTGLEGIQQIKALSPGTDIIMLTVINDHASIMQALCAGATGYLLKTSSMDVISDAIFNVVQGGAPMTPQIARSVLRLFVRYSPTKVDYGLSKQEKNVLELLVEGKVKKEIADLLSLSYHTVDNYVRGIYRKLHVHSLSAAVAKAVREKLF